MRSEHTRNVVRERDRTPARDSVFQYSVARPLFPLCPRCRRPSPRGGRQLRTAASGFRRVPRRLPGARSLQWIERPLSPRSQRQLEVMRSFPSKDRARRDFRDRSGASFPARLRRVLSPLPLISRFSASAQPLSSSGHGLSRVSRLVLFPRSPAGAPTRMKGSPSVHRST